MMVIMVLLSFTNYKQENVYYSVSNRAVFVSGLLLVMLAFTVSIILKMFEVKHILVLVVFEATTILFAFLKEQAELK